jgi:hypothetical protein
MAPILMRDPWFLHVVVDGINGTSKDAAATGRAQAYSFITTFENQAGYHENYLNLFQGQHPSKT